MCQLNNSTWLNAIRSSSVWNIDRKSFCKQSFRMAQSDEGVGSRHSHEFKKKKKKRKKK